MIGEENLRESAYPPFYFSCSLKTCVLWEQKLTRGKNKSPPVDKSPLEDKSPLGDKSSQKVDKSPLRDKTAGR
jgi:hypothetical protein